MSPARRERLLPRSIVSVRRPVRWAVSRPWVYAKSTGGQWRSPRLRWWPLPAAAARALPTASRWPRSISNRPRWACSSRAMPHCGRPQSMPPERWWRWSQYTGQARIRMWHLCRPPHVVTAAATGRVNVAASAGGVTGIAIVTVSPVSVADVVVVPETLTVMPKGTGQLNAAAFGPSGNEVAGLSVVWGSSHQSVATVDASGRVTGVTPGISTVTAAMAGRVASATVVVEKPPKPPAAPPPASPPPASPPPASPPPASPPPASPPPAPPPKPAKPPKAPKPPKPPKSSASQPPQPLP